MPVRLLVTRASARPGEFATIWTMATKITVNNNGPLRLEGDFEICDANGDKYDLAGRTVIGLCRCGHSENKPFCDGRHRAGGFESTCEAHALPPMKPKA
jgi:CDGSH-type Zn-finger protein